MSDGLKKTLSAFKNPQLKKKSTAVSLSLQVDGEDYLCDNVAPDADVEAGGGGGRAETNLQISQNSSDKEGLWDYVLSEKGEDCFPLWLEVQEEGRKSVVMGAVFYFPIGEHSELETTPSREVRVDMPRNATESEVRFLIFRELHEQEQAIRDEADSERERKAEIERAKE